MSMWKEYNWQNSSKRRHKLTEWLGQQTTWNVAPAQHADERDTVTQQRKKNSNKAQKLYIALRTSDSQQDTATLHRDEYTPLRATSTWIYRQNGSYDGYITGRVATI